MSDDSSPAVRADLTCQFDEGIESGALGPGEPCVEKHDGLIGRELEDLAQLLLEEIGAVERRVGLLDVRKGQETRFWAYTICRRALRKGGTKLRRFVAVFILASALLAGCGGSIQTGDKFYWHGNLYLVNGLSASGLRIRCNLGNLTYHGVQYEVCGIRTKPLAGRAIVLHSGFSYFLAGDMDVH